MIQEARAKKLALKSKKKLSEAEDIYDGRRLWKGGHRVHIWKTAEVTLTGPCKHHKTVTYFFKQLIFPMSILRKNPSILQKESLSPFH